MFSESDVNSIRCVLLDLQSSEDVGLFVLGRNYTVIATLIEAVLGLEVDDLNARRCQHR